MILLSGTIALAASPEVVGAVDTHAPRLEVPATRIDLGKVREGDSLSVCFDLRNAGAGPLEFHRVKSSCGCTRVDYPRTLAADADTTICLTIDSLGSHGRRTFKTAVYTNDPHMPTLVLQAAADIAPLVTLTPDRVFVRDAAGKTLEREIDIRTRGKMPLAVQLESHDLGNRAEVRLDRVEEGKYYRLRVKNRVMTPGAYRGRVILRTNYPGREHVAVPVLVQMTAPVAAYPSELVLDRDKCPACRDKGVYAGELIVRTQDDQPLPAVSVESVAGLDCRVDPLVPGRSYRIRVIHTAAQANAVLPADLIIVTGRGDIKTIVVPVRLRD